jgi:hypothetical protein
MKGGAYAGPDGMPRRGTETEPTSGTIWEWLRGVQPFGPLFTAGIDAGRAACALHWPLEFPNVMQRGGFDVVLGNPPWELIKLQEQEFFAARSPDIANAPNKAARDKLSVKRPLFRMASAAIWARRKAGRASPPPLLAAPSI